MSSKKSQASESRGFMCCVYGCNSRQYDLENKLTPMHFFRIPKRVLENRKLKDRWCSLIKRQDGRDGFNMKATTVICSDHFKEADINISLGTKKWTLKQNAEPTVFSWSVLTEGRKPPKPRVPLSTVGNVGTQLEETHEEPSCTEMSCDRATQTESYMCRSIETGCQVDLSELSFAEPELDSSILQHDHDYSFSQNVVSEEEKLTLHIKKIEEQNMLLLDRITELSNVISEYEANRFSIDKISEDKKAMMFYTGFPSIEAFNAFYQYLESKTEKLNYWRGKNDTVTDTLKPVKTKRGKKRTLSAKDELFMVLVRLKVGLFVRDISERFGISQGYFSKIFTTWINFLSHELPQLFPYPTQSLTRKNMPLEFKDYPTTRMILDCTEIFIEVPSSMIVQSQTWSSYKHHNTFKVLVGVNPNGCLTFISDLWGGRVSDREITLKSGVLDLLEPGDNLMADRGFNIDDILPPGVKLNMPPFLGGRSQLSAEEVTETMNIASVRITVEREIGRIKNYHILDGVMPLSLSHIAGQIVKVIGYLTNFLPPLLPPAGRVQTKLD